MTVSNQTFELKFFEENKAATWVYEHPRTTKIIKTTGFVLGASLLLSLPFHSSESNSLLTTANKAATGALVLTLSSVAHFTLDLFAPAHHDMKTHVYQEGEYEGGKLYYEGDIPILSLHSDDPFQTGKAHGYLCANAIDQVYRRLFFNLHFTGKEQQPENLSCFLDQIKRRIPDPYLAELEGVVEGYSLWAQEQPWWASPKKLTVNDLLYFHLWPDWLHLPTGLFIGMGREHEPIGCSAIIKRNPEGELTFARNLDWPSSGVLGTYSLVINRHDLHERLSTLEVGFPSLVGTVTGMNQQGLCLAMNSLLLINGSPNKMLPNGMPSLFYNRACLEECRDFENIKQFIAKHPPIGPYLLTVADQLQAASIQFYAQNLRGGTYHQIRFLTEENSCPLVTLNTDMALSDFKRFQHLFRNKRFHPDMERLTSLHTFFKENHHQPLENALALPFVNHGKTIHRIIMEPKTRTFKVAFDNAFAGKIPLQPLPAQKLFEEN